MAKKRSRGDSDQKKKSRAARERARRAREEGGPPEEESEPRPSAAVEWAKSIGIAFLLFIFLRTFVVQTFVITSGSMKETLLVGDMLVVNRLGVGARIPGTQARLPGYADPERGDIVVFDPHHDDTLKLIKRLIGMAGDTLEMRNRVLYRNGEILDEPYVVHVDEPDGHDPQMNWQRDHLVDTVDPATYRPTRETWGPIVVPEGHYFMLGDNRNQSLDSRFWGPLAEWRIEGEAVVVYFSYDRDSFRAFKVFTTARWGRIGEGID